jgi:hypothetical protein
MRKIITVVGIVFISAIVIAWSKSERQASTRTEVPTSAASMSPHEIMAKQDSNLPADYWAHPY